MDISILSLALGAPVEQTAQTPVAPGFDLTLEQAQVGGFVPPGAPPGPEPPPDILVAGEGVEVLEPNALPQKLDFLPQEKIDVEIELPKPFWEAPIDGELPVCPVPEQESPESAKPVDEAMQWLVGQMTSGFFATPTLSNNPVSPADSNCYDLRLPGSNPPPVFPPAIDTTQVVSMPPLLSSNTDLTEAPPRNPLYIAPEIVETLNIAAVEVHAPEFVKPQVPGMETEVVRPDVPKTETEVKPTTGFGNPVPVKEAPVVATMTPVETEAPIDPLFTKQPVQDNTKPVQAPDVKTETTPKDVASVAPAQTETAKPVAKAPAESTALEIAEPAAKTEKSANTGSQKGFDQPTKDDDTLAKAVIEAKTKTRESSEVKHARPDLAVDSVQTVRAPGTIEAKPEALSPKEIDLVMRQVVDKLHMLAAARPKNGVTIHLNPEDLGAITVVVKSIGRMVDTQLSATDHRVRQALDQNQTRLVEAMDARGFQVQSVTVSAQTNSSTQQESTRNWQQSGQEQGNNSSQSGQSHGHRGHGDRHFEQPKSNIRAWVRRGEGVDLSI